MISKKYLREFIRGFEKCKDSDFDWNAKLFQTCKDSSWGEVLLSRSTHLRANYEENEARISELESLLQKPLTDREYRNLADAALKIYQDGYDDIRVFMILLEPCIEYFKQKRDFDYLLPLIHAYCFECEQVQFELADNAKYTYEDILVYKDEYPNIATRYARLTILKAYSNVISRLLYNDELHAFPRMYSLYKDVEELWNRKEVQDLDGEDEEFVYFVARMRQSLALFENVDALTDEEKSIYKAILAEQLEDQESEFYPLICSISEVLKNREGLTSDEECADYLIHYFEETFAHLQEEGDANGQQDYIDDCYNIVTSMGRFLEGEHEVASKKEEMTACVNRLRNFVKDLPYDFYNAEMNNYVSVLYQKVKTYMSYEEKRDYLLEVIMFRQPITCIHALMVSRLSTLLCKAMLQQKPDLLVGVLDTKNTGDVHAKEKEILDFVSECALFHDVGKVAIAGIINMQNRRLSDLEFARLKTHSEGGVTFLGNDKDFAKFYDVMRGHHKWYDGKGGYPASFDNLSSPVRIIIDLVTISDCLDAATDILGRNYGKGKTVDVVIDEFKAQAGTRYNPEIVSLIANDPKLLEDLRRQTTDGRMDVYREVYSKYIERN